MSEEVKLEVLGDDDFDANGDIRPEAASAPSSEAVARRLEQARMMRTALKPLADFPKYIPEPQNPNILIRGRWLERGGSAWFVSTAGTGKSIHSLQMALCMSAGLPFGGLTPNIVEITRPLRFWILQSEDSDSRVTIDREDIISELNEQYPITSYHIDWRKVSKSVIFVNINGKIGADLIKYLDNLLKAAKTEDAMPDVITFNPFLAFVGGPVTDGGYVTPFLRGGEIMHSETIGIQGLITKHNVGAIFYHHTPKPPTEKELDGWLNSMFPEYQGAGSSDITNWGRSFVTMMKCKKNPRVVCMVAGKNGGELGWQEIGGSRRHYLAWSGKPGIVEGSLRHAWRELTEDELAEICGEDVKMVTSKVEECITDTLAQMRSGRALYREGFERVMLEKYKRKVCRLAWAELTTTPTAKKYQYQIADILWGHTKRKYIGFAEPIDAVRRQGREQYRVEQTWQGLPPAPAEAASNSPYVGAPTPDPVQPQVVAAAADDNDDIESMSLMPWER